MVRISLPLVGILLLGLCLVGSVSSARQSSSRQSGKGETSLATTGQTPLASLRKILAPAIESLVGVPLRLLRQLLLDINNFMRSHTLGELYDVKFLQQVVSRLPDRFIAFWKVFSEMESECMNRTVCDLTELISLRVPKWAEQMALIYLNAFAKIHPFYQVASDAITTHQCAKLYAECNAQLFMDRLRGNLTESFNSTIAPLRDAFTQLVNVTSTTLSSLNVDEREAAVAKPNRMTNHFSDEDNREDTFREDRQFEPRPMSSNHRMAQPSDSSMMMPNQRGGGASDHIPMRQTFQDMPPQAHMRNFVPQGRPFPGH